MDEVAALLLEEKRQAEAADQQLPLTIIFVERKARCDDVAEILCHEGLKAAALHGGMSQGEREGSLADFTAGRVQVLVATDVASRGLDVKGIGHVINLDLPRTFEDYVHRIGRTGRAGTTGKATSFWTERDSFLVTQIKKALSDLESGNTFAFATGKAARQKEKELAQEFKQKLATGPSSVMQSGAAAVKVDDRYKFMTASASKAGAADSAWDD
jgi:ATP-dependent RNA helicase DDX5/DBP2